MIKLVTNLVLYASRETSEAITSLNICYKTTNIRIKVSVKSLNFRLP